MNGKQMCNHFLLSYKTVQVASCVIHAAQAITILIYFSKIKFILFLLELYQPISCKGSSESCSSCWINTVKHIHSKTNTHNKVLWIANTHEISRLVFWQILTAKMDHLNKVFFFLSATQSSNSIAICIKFLHFFNAFFS